MTKDYNYRGYELDFDYKFNNPVTCEVIVSDVKVNNKSDINLAKFLIIVGIVTGVKIIIKYINEPLEKENNLIENSV